MRFYKLKTKLAMYFAGFFIMTLGIALSVKSNLGVSPVSSIPYAMTCIWGIEMGLATIIFHVILVLMQILILRKKYKVINLLQIPVGVVFGFFTTFCNYLMSFAPSPQNLAVRIVMLLLSTFFVAFGIFLYVPTALTHLAGEGTMLAVSQVSGIKFSTVKIIFDISMVLISLVLCLVFIHSMGSVGIGTIIAAVLVGLELKLITKVLGTIRNKILD